MRTVVINLFALIDSWNSGSFYQPHFQDVV